MDGETNLIFSWNADGGAGRRQIRLFRGDLTLTEEDYDVVVCSAFRGSYVPTLFSLIGALHRQRNISVAELSKRREIDLRDMHCWLAETGSPDFRRIACLELLDWMDFIDGKQQEINDGKLLKSSFITLRYLLEQADARGIPLRRIALTVPGAGEQGINLAYAVPPLVTQCKAMFSTIGGLETIDFYERQPEQAEEIRRMLAEVLSGPKAEAPLVFLSYSTRQADWAERLRKALRDSGLSVWMAPDSIPSGSSYLKEIPLAITGVKVLLLLLTEDAELSPWVQKEVSSAIGARKTVIPVELYAFEKDPAFRFMLDGIQILPLWSCGPEMQEERVVAEVNAKLRAMA